MEPRQPFHSNAVSSIESQQPEAWRVHLQYSAPTTTQQVFEGDHARSPSSRLPKLDPDLISDGYERARQQLSEFTLFPKLPTELRLPVWGFAVFPRVVSLVPGRGKPPAILSACRESRKETRKLYRLCLHVSSPKGHPGIRNAPEFGIFINYEVDIIYFTPMHIFSGTDMPSESDYDEDRNSDGPRAAFWSFPVWTMPAKR